MADYFERSPIVHEQIGGKLAVSGKLPLRIATTLRSPPRPVLPRPAT